MRTGNSKHVLLRLRELINGLYLLAEKLIPKLLPLHTTNTQRCSFILIVLLINKFSFGLKLTWVVRQLEDKTSICEQSCRDSSCTSGSLFPMTYVV